MTFCCCCFINGLTRRTLKDWIRWDRTEGSFWLSPEASAFLDGFLRLFYFGFTKVFVSHSEVDLYVCVCVNDFQENTAIGGNGVVGCPSFHEQTPHKPYLINTMIVLYSS